MNDGPTMIHGNHDMMIVFKYINWQSSSSTGYNIYSKLITVWIKRTRNYNFSYSDKVCWRWCFKYSLLIKAERKKDPKNEKYIVFKRSLLLSICIVNETNKDSIILSDHTETNSSVYSVVSDQIYHCDSSWMSCAKCTHRSSGESNRKQKKEKGPSNLEVVRLYLSTHIFSFLFVLATILFLGCHRHRPKMVKRFSIGFATWCPAGRANLWVGKQPRETVPFEAGVWIK